MKQKAIRIVLLFVLFFTMDFAHGMGARFRQRFTQFKSFFNTQFRKPFTQGFDSQSWFKKSYSKFKNLAAKTTHSASFKFLASSAGLAGVFFMSNEQRVENEKAAEKDLLEQFKSIDDDKDLKTNLERFEKFVSLCKTEHDKELLATFLLEKKSGSFSINRIYSFSVDDYLFLATHGICIKKLFLKYVERSIHQFNNIPVNDIKKLIGFSTVFTDEELNEILNDLFLIVKPDAFSLQENYFIKPLLYFSIEFQNRRTAKAALNLVQKQNIALNIPNPLIKASLLQLIGPKLKNFEKIKITPNEKELIEKIISLHNEVPCKSTLTLNEALKTAITETEGIPRRIFSAINPAWFADDKLQTVINKLAYLENFYNEENYYTFVHGAQRDNLVPTLIFTVLFELKKQTEFPGFLKLHIKPFNSEDETEKHLSLLKNGVRNYNEKNLIFANTSLFANQSRRGECTANYFIESKNVWQKPITIEQVFQDADFKSLLTNEIKTEIERLQNEYKKASYGTLYLIAIPKEKINETGRTSRPGGKSLYDFKVGDDPYSAPEKRTLYDMSEIMENIESTRTRTTKKPSLQFSPKQADQTIVVFPETNNPNSIGSPTSGVKITPITTLGDDEQKKADALLLKIKQMLQDEYKKQQLNKPKNS